MKRLKPTFIYAAAGAIIFTLMPYFSFAGELPKKTLTFKEFYQKVAAYYPKLKQQEADINLALVRKMQASAGLMPRLQGATSITYSNDPVFVFGSLLRENAFSQDNFELSKLNNPSPHTSYNFSLEGQLPIFDAFQAVSRVRSSKLLIDSARDEAALSRMEALLVAAEAYLRAIAIEKLSVAADEIDAASREDVLLAEELNKQGLILGADFYTAKLMSGNINQLRNQLAQEKQAAHILMNILMGADPISPFEIAGDFSNNSEETRPLQDWFEQAYKLRPDLAAAEKTIRAQDIEVSREKSSALPKINAFGQAREDTHSLNSGGGQNFTVGVKADVDIFDPAYSARVRATKETLKKLQINKEILKQAISQDIANEYSHYTVVSQNLPVASGMLGDAKQAVNLMMPLYREGRKSIADLLQIRESYLNIARQYYALAIDTRASWTRLLYLSGQLDESRMLELERRLAHE